MMRDPLVRLGGRLLALALLLLFGAPMLALLVTIRVSDLDAAGAHGLQEALTLSLSTSAVSMTLTVACGTPLAWWIGRRASRWTRAMEMLVRVPTVTPPAVAGIALLSAFGRAGPFGALSLPFSAGAVVVAQLFVASPFFVLPLAAAFREIDDTLLLTARSLGAGPAKVFGRVALPMVAPAFLGGLGVAWARALGEFGATLVFAGNLPGVTQTLPVAIYVSMEGDLGPARALSLVLLVVALAIFFALRSRFAERALGRVDP